MSIERTQTIAPAVASATSVHAATALLAAAQTVSTAITSPDVYRCVSVKGNQASVTGNVVVTGTDWNGGTVADTIALSGASTVAGVKAMKTVVSYVLPALASAGDTVSVGCADKFGLYGDITASGDVILTERAASGATEFTIEANGTVNTTYNTVTATIVSGDRLRWAYLDSGLAAAGDATLFSVAEARAFDKAQLTSVSLYSDATITAKEITIRAKFEREIGVALAPTASTEYHDGDGTDTLYLDHHNPRAVSTPSPLTVSSITVIATDDTETAFTATELADVVKYSNKLVRRSGTFTRGSRNILVVYTHGYTTPPDDLKTAALYAVAQELIPTSVPSSVIDGSDGQINWLRTKDPERGRWYGNEAIDAVLREHRNHETLLGIL